MSACSPFVPIRARSPTRICGRVSKRSPRRTTANARRGRMRRSIRRLARWSATPARRSSPTGWSCNSDVKPRIAITVGDPAGIGPEIARKAAADSRVLDACEPVLYSPPADAHFTPGALSAEAGRAAYDAICAAVRDAQAGLVDGLATAPVNKLAFARAGLSWKGHTDLLGHLTGSRRVAMMFWSEPLKVVLATVHVPLREVSRLLTAQTRDARTDLNRAG